MAAWCTACGPRSLATWGTDLSTGIRPRPGGGGGGVPFARPIRIEQRQTKNGAETPNAGERRRTNRARAFRSGRSAFRSCDRPQTRVDAHFPQFRSFRSCICMGSVVRCAIDHQAKSVTPRHERELSTGAADHPKATEARAAHCRRGQARARGLWAAPASRRPTTPAPTAAATGPSGNPPNGGNSSPGFAPVLAWLQG